MGARRETDDRQARKVRRAWLAALLAVLVPGAMPAAANAADAAPTPAAGFPAIVYLVRHAEKATQPYDDPPLTDAGRERAQALAAALKNAGVTAVVTSDRLRTRETAAPIARARGLEPVAISRPEGSLDRHVAAVAAEVLRHPGGVVLVVGHTDTLPAIVTALGGPTIGEIGDDEFDNLFILSGTRDKVRLARARYGAPSGRP